MDYESEVDEGIHPIPALDYFLVSLDHAHSALLLLLLLLLVVFVHDVKNCQKCFFL